MPTPPDKTLDHIRALFEELGESVSGNTRDLAKIAKQLEERSDDIEEIRHLAIQITLLEERIDVMREKLDALSKIVVHGNGQKALTIKVHELDLRIGALQHELESKRKRDPGTRDIAAVEDAKGKWKVRALMAGGAATVLSEIFHWIQHLFPGGGAH